MNLSDITTQPYILALFKRDDGTRFLLGLGAYEFKDSQQHFIANTMVNDVVDMQGTDGALLAGQVRRASTQSFDGYVGDGGVIKSTIEQYRKDFIAYFQKNHFYTVVYIFADGTAIQRKRGYIIDSPEVKELYQMAPEYHVALNFEDVNYYKYAENSDGDEIYSNTANITSKITTTGGLIWSNVSAVPITGEGTSFTLYGTLAEENLQSVQLKGQTSQTTYLGKNLVYTKAGIDGGITFTYDSATGATTITGQQSYGFSLSQRVATNLPAGTYTVSIDAPQAIIIGVGIYDGSDNRTAEEIPVGQTSLTFTALAPIAKFETIVAGLDSGTTYNLTFKLQLESGSTATPFEPYTGGIASPNPEFPQTVQTVSGTQTITITDGDSQTQTFSVRLGSLELCKIGTYQDYIYKSGDDWYVHKETGKLDLSGTTSWWLSGVQTDDVTQVAVWVGAIAKIDDESAGYSNILGVETLTEWGTRKPNFSVFSGNNYYVRVSSSLATTAEQWQTYLSTHTMLVYYALATATDTQITDADLISDLDDLLGADTYSPSTAFEITATNNLPAWLSVSAHSGSGGVVWDNIGATWEEGGEGGDSFVTVDSITDVFPTITIIGAAHNPKITNITTGQVLQYTGNVASGQKLVIDVQQKTAKLSGTSVITNVSGDWLYLKPGINRIVYTIDNATVNYATIEWQEITG